MKKYKILIKTNSYVGNFERELCAYVFGCYWDVQEWVNELTKTAEEEIGGVLSDKLYYFNDDHGQTVCEIDHDSNNLIVFFEQDPSKHKNLILERLEKFPDILSKTWEFAPKNVKILETKFLEITTSEKEI